MLLHLLDVPDLVPRQAETSQELEGEGNPEAAKVAVVADEVLDVPDVLKYFVSKDEYLVAAEVQLLEVVELVKDPWGELAEVVVGEVELLQVGQVVKGGRGDGGARGAGEVRGAGERLGVQGGGAQPDDQPDQSEPRVRDGRYHCGED